MRKNLVEDLKIHLRGVSKEYLECHKGTSTEIHFQEVVTESIFALISTAIVLLENNLITLEEKRDLEKFASDTLDILK